MKGDVKVIEFFNKVFYNELIVINQYFLYVKMLKNWGLKELVDYEYKELIEEMKYVDILFDCIFFFEGLLNFQVLGKLCIGENLCEILQCDLVLECDGVVMLCEVVVYVDLIVDYVSCQLFVKIFEFEEEYIDWLEIQLDLMDCIGELNYLLIKIED